MTMVTKGISQVFAGCLMLVLFGCTTHDARMLADETCLDSVNPCLVEKFGEDSSPSSLTQIGLERSLSKGQDTRNQSSTGARSASLERMEELVERHDRVAAAAADLEAAQNRVQVALGDLYPTLDASASGGRERLDKPGNGTDTNQNFGEVSFKVTQLLWDHGKTNADIESARLALARAEIQYFQVKQQIWLEAVSAIVNLQRNRQILAFANQSEQNIRNQTGLEEARVSAGGGLSTDVLQSKTQLAGAQSRRIVAQGALRNAENRYRAVFGSPPPRDGSHFKVALRSGALPKSVRAAIQFSYMQNAQLRIAAIDEAVAGQTVESTRRGEFSPTIKAIAEQTYKHNVSGVQGREENSSIKVQLDFPFNLGLTSIDTLRAVQSDAVAASHRVRDAQRTVEEQVRVAWQNLETARLNAASLGDQASLAEAFLELARQERALGNRGLIDVLSGETALINSRSDAASSRADILIAEYTLINAIGRPMIEALR